MPAVPEPEKELLSWTAPARPHKPLDKQLFSVAIVISILISVILAFAGEFMLIVVIVSLLFAYYALSTYPPENTTYTLTTWGIHAHGQTHKWDQLTRWWTEGNLLVCEAPLERFRRVFLVLDPKITTTQLQDLLAKYLPYEQPAPTSLDKASSWLTRTFPLTK